MIPCSRPKCSDLYTLSWSKLLENDTFTAAHTYKAHIWQYPPPDSKGAKHNWYLQLRHLNEFQILSYDSSHFLLCLVLMCIESLLHFFKQGNKGRGRGAPLGRGKEQVTSSKGRGRYSGGRKYKLPVFS